MKKYIIICIYTLSTLVAFADYENYSSENVSGQNFSEGSHNNSTWDKAIAVETIFSTAESATSYENSSFKSADLSYAEFIAANLTGANLDGADFTGARLDYTILKDSIITNANFTESVKRGINWDVISTTKSFKDKNLSGIILDSNNLTGWDLSNQNLTDSSFKNANFTNALLIRADLTGANLDGADFTGARLDYTILKDSIITNANFTESVKRGINWDVISTTKSFKDKNLSGIILDSNNLTGWDLSNQNLSNASFIRVDLTGANLDGADFTGTDLRGAKFSELKGIPLYKNTIMSDGIIQNFSMESVNDNFSIREYIPSMEDSQIISAKINQSATISGGAILTLEIGAQLELTDNAILTVSDESSIIINTDIDSSTNLEIIDSAKLAFEDGSIFEINLNYDGDLSGQTVVFSALNWNTTEQALDIDNLKKDETFILSLNGEDFNGEWDYFIENNSLMISMQIPEPATYAAIFGALAIAFAAYRRRK